MIGLGRRFGRMKKWRPEPPLRFFAPLVVETRWVAGHECWVIDMSSRHAPGQQTPKIPTDPRNIRTVRHRVSHLCENSTGYSRPSSLTPPEPDIEPLKYRHDTCGLYFDRRPRFARRRLLQVDTASIRRWVSRHRSQLGQPRANVISCFLEVPMRGNGLVSLGAGEGECEVTGSDIVGGRR